MKEEMSCSNTDGPQALTCGLESTCEKQRQQRAGEAPMPVSSQTLQAHDLCLFSLLFSHVKVVGLASFYLVDLQITYKAFFFPKENFKL